jgi:cardiolipin synthase
MYRKKNKAGSPYVTGNNITLLKGGEEYFDLLIRLINEAAHIIHLQVYIFSNDETGREVAVALKNAARRGVDVYLLADGYASQQLPKEFIAQLRNEGVHFRFFEPFLKSKHFYFGRRLHHKLFMVDFIHAMVGGINIADRYNSVGNEQAWLDFAMHVQGDIVNDLCRLCWRTWNGFPEKSPDLYCEPKKTVSVPAPAGNVELRMRCNDWVMHENEISATYIEMFYKAKSHITILCSYFLPGKIIRRLLRHAAARGVKIKVITAGPSDVMIAKHAERWMYDWLLRNNIELYEYQPTVLHAKVAVCDDRWATIGSYNINNISAYASIELNLDVRDDDFATQLQQQMNEIIVSDCRPVTDKNHLYPKNIFMQFIRWFSYFFIRVAFYLVTFYYKRGG